MQNEHKESCTVGNSMEQMVELIRSFNEVCKRKGEQTNWDALTTQVNKILNSIKL